METGQAVELPISGRGAIDQATEGPEVRDCSPSPPLVVVKHSLQA